MASQISQDGITRSEHTSHSVNNRTQETLISAEIILPHSTVALCMICVALIISFFLSALDTTIVATAIPKITDDFGTLQDTVWYGSAFFIALGAFQSTWGKAYNCFNLKFTFFAAIFIFELGSLLCGVAPNSLSLIIGRGIAGVGAAGIGSGAFTIFAFAADPSKRPLFAAVIGITYGVASVLGPIIGGAFTNNLSWRWCFYVNLPAGAFAVLVLMRFFRPPPRPEQQATWLNALQQMDFVGVIIVLGILTSYVLALQFGGQTHRWNSPTVVGLLVGSGTLSIILVFWEYHAGECAMVVPRLFAKRHIHMSCLYIFCLAGSYYVAVYYLPIYFQSVGDASPTMSAVRNLPLIIAVSCAMVISAIIMFKTSHHGLTMVIGATIATVGAGLLYTLDQTMTVPHWIGYQILGGAGWGLGFQIPILVCQSRSTAADLAPVTATTLFFSNMGGAYFLSAAHAVFANKLLSSLRSTIPQIEPTAVLEAGATELRQVFSSEEVPRIVLSYMEGIKGAFIVSVAGAGCAFIASLGSKLERPQDTVSS